MHASFQLHNSHNQSVNVQTYLQTILSHITYRHNEPIFKILSNKSRSNAINQCRIQQPTLEAMACIFERTLCNRKTHYYSQRCTADLGSTVAVLKPGPLLLKACVCGKPATTEPINSHVAKVNATRSILPITTSSSVQPTKFKITNIEDTDNSYQII